MQEEVESRTVNLAISTSKLSARTIVSAVKAYLNHRKSVKVKKEHEAEIPTHGKQTVKELIVDIYRRKNAPSAWNQRL